LRQLLNRWHSVLLSMVAPLSSIQVHPQAHDSFFLVAIHDKQDIIWTSACIWMMLRSQLTRLKR
jgi:hypothetical protein